MKKLFYLFILTMVSNLTKAQIQFSYVGFGEENNVIKHLDKAAANKDNVESGYKFNSYKKNDTLVLTVSGPEKNIRKLTFNSKKKKCDFDQIILPSCDQCSRRQVEVIVNDKKMKWKEISKNQYLSSIVWKTLLTISYDKNNLCTVMTFKELNLDRNAYLKLYGDYGDYATAKNISIPKKTNEELSLK